MEFGWVDGSQRCLPFFSIGGKQSSIFTVNIEKQEERRCVLCIVSASVRRVRRTDILYGLT